MKKKLIIAIGDWYIDENWLISRQKTFKSSHSGDIHYQARNDKSGREFINFCGIPGIILLLENFFKSSIDAEFIGIGAWNYNDNDIMKCLLCEHNFEGKLLTPHTFFSLKEPQYKNFERYCPYDKNKCQFTENINLLNIIRKDLDKNISTNHVIRCFEGHKGGKPNLMYRYDWLSNIVPDDINNNIIDDYTQNHNDTLLGNQFASALIIEDHGLGVVCEESLAILKNYIDKDTKIFIRSKLKNPKWLTTITQKEDPAIELIVSDHMLAGYKMGRRKWRYGKELGRASLEFLDCLRRIENSQDNFQLIKRAAILLDENTVIGGDETNYFFIPKPVEERQFVNMGRTTGFFASLIAQILDEIFEQEKTKEATNLSKKDEIHKANQQEIQKETVNQANSEEASQANQQENAHEYEFNIQCKKARDFAFQWSKNFSNQWRSNEILSFHTIYNDVSKTFSKIKEQTEEKLTFIGRDRETILRNWEKAFNKYSIIESEKNMETIQLWRGECSLPGYIVVGGPKRDAINHLINRVAEFKSEKQPSYSLSCLLTAFPGWGKSFLARRLAQHFDMSYLEFSIAQMPTTDAFVDCLATIASVQNRTNEKLLIFIDEINAQIEGHDVYGLLLGPLSDGSFVFEGKSYRLSPAVWIFASSATPRETPKDSKGSDFFSRLNGPIINLDYIGDNENIIRTINTLKRELYNVTGDDNCFNANIENKYKEYMNFNQINKLRTEQVYLLINLLIKVWGPINKIQKCVVKQFFNLMPINGIRSMEFFASRFIDIKNGEVKWQNIPDLEQNIALRRHIILEKNWLTHKSREEHFSKLNSKDKKTLQSFINIETYN